MDKISSVLFPFNTYIKVNTNIIIAVIIYETTIFSMHICKDSNIVTLNRTKNNIILIKKLAMIFSQVAPLSKLSKIVNNIDRAITYFISNKFLVKRTKEKDARYDIKLARDSIEINLYLF